MKMTKRKLDLGLTEISFSDRNKVSCSVEESSIAFDNAIWLGVNNANPQRLVKGQGWVPFIIPDDVLLTTRMHLTQEQVKTLLPVLERFVKTGRISK